MSQGSGMLCVCAKRGPRRGMRCGSLIRSHCKGNNVIARGLLSLQSSLYSPSLSTLRNSVLSSSSPPPLFPSHPIRRRHYRRPSLSLPPPPSPKISSTRRGHYISCPPSARTNFPSLLPLIQSPLDSPKCLYHSTLDCAPSP